MKVKITSGWAKGKVGVLVKEYTEIAFGVEWCFADIQITDFGRKWVLKFTPSQYEVM